MPRNQKKMSKIEGSHKFQTQYAKNFNAKKGKKLSKIEGSHKFQTYKYANVQMYPQ